MTTQGENKEVKFLKFILEYILDEPEKADIQRIVDEKGVLLEVKVPEKEMGKLIGKQGKTAQSIRILLNTIGAKLGIRIYLKILEPADKSGGSSTDEIFA